MRLWAQLFTVLSPISCLRYFLTNPGISLVHDRNLHSCIEPVSLSCFNGIGNRLNPLQGLGLGPLFSHLRLSPRPSNYPSEPSSWKKRVTFQAARIHCNHGDEWHLFTSRCTRKNLSFPFTNLCPFIFRNTCLEWPGYTATIQCPAEARLSREMFNEGLIMLRGSLEVPNIMYPHAETLRDFLLWAFIFYLTLVN